MAEIYLIGLHPPTLPENNAPHIIQNSKLTQNIPYNKRQIKICDFKTTLLEHEIFPITTEYAHTLR